MSYLLAAVRLLSHFVDYDRSGHSVRMTGKRKLVASLRTIVHGELHANILRAHHPCCDCYSKRRKIVEVDLWEEQIGHDHVVGDDARDEDVDNESYGVHAFPNLCSALCHSYGDVGVCDPLAQ